MFNIHETVKAIPRIKGTEAYMVCAIAIALSILWEMWIQKMKIPKLTEYELGEERKVERIELPDLHDKCTCWKGISSEEKIGSEVVCPKFCKTARSFDDSFEFLVVKVS